MEQAERRVLIVDDDADIASLVEELLSEDGYAVTILRDAQIEAIQAAVARVQPDCMLLDGGVGSGYEESWESAALMAARLPALPVIMFTAHASAVTEALENTSNGAKRVLSSPCFPSPSS